MIKFFHKMKYCVWNVNLDSLKKNANFNIEIEEKFKIQSTVLKRPPEAHGDAYSIGIKTMNSFEEKFLDILCQNVCLFGKVFHEHYNINLTLILLIFYQMI